MSACPHCGFTYGWDGTKCSHCYHNYPDELRPPKNDHDDMRERCILRKASKHNLPGRRTVWFYDLPTEHQISIQGIAGEKMQGRPILVFFDSQNRWTLLTAREVIGLDKGNLHAVRLCDLVDVRNHSDPPIDATLNEVRQWKGTWEYLRLTDCHSRIAVVWVPSGNEAYALWNILLPLTR